MKEEENISDLLSIFDLCRQGSRALGPGLRYVIWTQGCPFHCDGCVTPSSRPITKERQVQIHDLADDILNRPNIEGITISGGEPFIQSRVLADLLDLVLLNRPELTVIVYTGFMVETLTGTEEKRLLEHIDLLIDGPYMKEFNDNKGLRGSSNQRFHFITPRLLRWKEELQDGKRRVEYHLTPEGAKIYGVPPASFTNIKDKQQ